MPDLPLLVDWKGEMSNPTVQILVGRQALSTKNRITARITHPDIKVSTQRYVDFDFYGEPAADVSARLRSLADMIDKASTPAAAPSSEQPPTEPPT